MRHVRTITLMLTLLLALTGTFRSAAQATAQPETYRWDLGGALGMAGYLGDANESGLFSHPSVSVAASLRYLINTRFALRALLSGLALGPRVGLGAQPGSATRSAGSLPAARALRPEGFARAPPAL